jgi:hypothetical protein
MPSRHQIRTRNSRLYMHTLTLAIPWDTSHHCCRLHCSRLPWLVDSRGAPPTADVGRRQIRVAHVRARTGVQLPPMTRAEQFAGAHLMYMSPAVLYLIKAHYMSLKRLLSARTNTNVPRIGARLPLRPGSLPLGAQHDKLDALLLCLARLWFNRSMATIPSPWRMEAGWRRWRLSWLIAWIFRWLFVASLAWGLLTLAPCALTVMSVYAKFRSSIYLCSFSAFLGGCAT